MSRVSYNTKRLIPAPFVEFTKTYQTTDDGEKVGSIWNIAMNGKAISYMGSPNSSGVFWTLGGFPSDEIIDENHRLGSILRKQEAIRDLFSEDGYQLEFQSEAADSAPMKCNPRINEINFVRDLWWNYVEYNIQAEADVLYINGLPYGEDNFSGYIETATESWQLETDDEQPESLTEQRTYRVSHSLNAKGKRFYNDSAALEKPAWQQARDWVVPRLGFDNSIAASSVIGSLSSHNAYNYVRSENIDENGGTYAVTENWILSKESAFETFEVSTRTSVGSALTNVTIEGNVIGLEVRNSSLGLVTSKYENSLSKFSTVSTSAFTRAQSYAGLSLNSVPLATNIGKNPINGVITYSYEYDNRPTNLITNAISEVISINDSLSTDVVAIIPIINRTAGPILQNIGTSKEKRRTLDIEIIVDVSALTSISAILSTKPTQTGTILDVINAVNPINNGATKCFLEDNTERWEAREGRYSLSKSWVYE